MEVIALREVLVEHRPLVFSLEPRCHGLCGSQKNPGMPVRSEIIVVSGNGLLAGFGDVAEPRPSDADGFHRYVRRHNTGGMARCELIENKFYPTVVFTSWCALS